MNLKKLNKLQARAQHLHRQLEALLVLGNDMTRAKRVEFESQKAGVIERPTIKRVQEHINQTEQHIEDLRRLLGVRVPNHTLIEILEMVEAAPEGKTALVSKHVIERLFERTDRTFEQFDRFPAHVRIMIYQTKPNHHDAEPKTVDWRSIEATLFEDMCAMFNLAKEIDLKTITLSPDLHRLRTNKTLGALARATASAAFYFVEAYLNGLAYDHYISVGSRLDDEARKKLTEFDGKQNRPSYLSLRDKLLQYPKIILRAEHPPLQENNCPELDFICNTAKELRDSIVHASPRPDPESLKPTKETYLFNTSFEEVQRIVDKAIALVRKLEVTVGGNDSGLFWMHERAPDGFFPPAVFL